MDRINASVGSVRPAAAIHAEHYAALALKHEGKKGRTHASAARNAHQKAYHAHIEAAKHYERDIIEFPNSMAAKGPHGQHISSHYACALMHVRRLAVL